MGKCDTPGCGKPAVRTVNLGPGTFLKLCQECADELAKQDA